MTIKQQQEVYRGHEITVSREPSMTGEVLLFYSVFRESDGYECTSGFSYSDESPHEFAAGLRSRVDAELGRENPWDED